jgi:hypothetical protein
MSSAISRNMIGFHAHLDSHNKHAKLHVAQTAVVRPAMIGPKEIKMHLTGGTVTVYLPHRIAAGDRVSGSVFPSSKGDWNTQHQNLNYLSSLYLRIGDQRVDISHITFNLQVADPVLKMDVEDASGTVLAQTDLDLSESDLEFPNNDAKVVQAGKPIGVSGTFDGDRDRTYASFDGRPIGILAEGSSEC